MLNQFSPDEDHGPSAAERAQVSREQWLLSHWQKSGGELLHSVGSHLFFCAKQTREVAHVQQADREALHSVRKELLLLMQQGISIQTALSDHQISTIDVATRGRFLEAIDDIREQILPVIDRVTVIYEGLIQDRQREVAASEESESTECRSRGTRSYESSLIEDLRNQSKWLAARFEVFGPLEMKQFEVVDVIALAVRFFPREVSWEHPPSELALATRCKSVELEYVLSEITDTVEDAIRAVALAGIQEVFRESLEDMEEFCQTFNVNMSRYHDLMVYRPTLSATMTAPDTVALSVEVSPDTRSEWIESIPLLNERLENARYVASRNGCYVTVNLQEYPSSLTVSLTVSTPEADSFDTGRPRSPYRLIHQPETDTVTFPVRVPGKVEGVSASVPVTVQRTALMSADALISLRDTLEAVSDFITLSSGPWESVVCAANCSITLNEDSYREAFFECTLNGPERGGSQLEDDLWQLYSFPWEEEPLDSEVAFYLRYNARRMPDRDTLLLPANAFMNDEIRVTLVRLFDKFQTVHFDAGVQSDLATLYSPEERVEVINALVGALDAWYSDSTNAIGLAERVFWCAGAYLDFNSDSVKQRELFQVEVYDAAKRLVECGAFSSTTFEFSMRPHSQQLEEEALTRFQRVLDSVKENGDLTGSLVACGLLIDHEQLEILQEPFKKTGLAAVEADPVRTLVSLCRDPWNRLERVGEYLRIRDAGHPPAPSQSVSYGSVRYFGTDSRPVTIFRQALMLYKTEQAGKNNGYTFKPSEAFFERAAGNNHLPLDS